MRGVLYWRGGRAGMPQDLGLARRGSVWFHVLAGAAGVLLILWYALAMAWSSSVAKHRPELHGTVQRTRYGWKCPRCGRVHVPACKVNKCGGPLVWVQRETRIKCTRCYRHFVAHPMLFRQLPRPRPMWCRQCNWIGVVRDWKVS